MAKMLGGRGSMDPIDAYRLEQERQKKEQARQEKAVARDVNERASPDPSSDTEASGPGAGAKILAGIFGVLALLSFIATILAGMFLDGWQIPFCFGLTFFLFGLTALISSRHPVTAVFAIVGFVVAALSLAYGLGTDDTREFIMGMLAPCAGLSVFVIAGAGMLVAPRVIASRRRGEYTEHVPARITDKTLYRWTDSDGDRHKGWKLTWTYYAHGKDYTYASNVCRYPEKREIGDMGELLVRPDDPGDVWEPPERAETVILTVMGILFMAVGIGALALFLGGAATF